MRYLWLLVLLSECGPSVTERYPESKVRTFAEVKELVEELDI